MVEYIKVSHEDSQNPQGSSENKQSSLRFSNVESDLSNAQSMAEVEFLHPDVKVRSKKFQSAQGSVFYVSLPDSKQEYVLKQVSVCLVFC